jgi:quinohemoprotein ethanol dehydrogenase
VPLSADAFWAIVHDGALIQNGMPPFKIFGKPQIEALRQYVRSTARAELEKK